MKKFILFIALIASIGASAQNSMIEEGDYYFDKFNFPEAMQFYLEAYQGDSSNAYVARHIGLCMRKLGMLEESADYFFKAIELTADTPEDMLYYAEALKSKADYAKAIFWYAQFANERPEDQRAQKHILDTRYFQDLWADSLKYAIKRLAINTDKPSFGMCKYNEGYIFSSAGIKTSTLQQSTSDEIPYLDIYECALDKDGEAMDAKLIEGNVNSKYHDGPAFFDATRNTMFVTRNNIKRGKPVYDQSGTANLKVYSVKKIAGEWAKSQDLPFNSDEFSVGHPCVNDMGNLMIFVSNMPGGYGGTDLYKVEMNGDEWGEPENLGPKINTEGNEMFPFISPQGYLYFGSDGHAGLGGLDIFVSEVNPLGYSEPNNLGFPINSPQDDFSIFYDEDAEVGYFATNRTGTDNVFRFSVVNFIQQIVAMTFENEYGVDLAGKNVTLRWLEAQADSTIRLDETGSFQFLAEAGKEFEVFLGNGASRSSEPIASFTTADQLADTYHNLGKFNVNREALEEVGLLEKAMTLVASAIEQDTEQAGLAATGQNIRDMLLRLRDETNFLSHSEFDELSNADLIDDSELNRLVSTQSETIKEKNKELKEYKLNNIYFGFDSYSIRSSEKTKVGALTKILKEDPNVNVVIKAHTDSRGNADYNLLLSMRRAKSIQQHLEKQGIDPNRFQIAWVGENELYVDCNNQPCGAADHALNRRAEVVFISNDTVSND